jgi:N4-(beta-N-acetylglucosaminyl)-L-asparaginase
MKTRREFLGGTALATAALAVKPLSAQQSLTAAKNAVADLKPPAKPVIVTRVTGDDTIQRAWEMLSQGADTLTAIHHICLGRENDPNDHTVGLGGLPNEDGVVELDSCCMHGPSRMAGSVGGVRNIKNVCLAARAVMEHTGHVMLAGEGAERFAVDMGYPRENLLTEEARKIWILWKETNSTKDWWGTGPGNPNWRPPEATAPTAKSPHARLRNELPRIPGPEHAQLLERSARSVYEAAADLGIPPAKRWKAVADILFPPTGTIHVSAVNGKGEMSGATTTSGLAWKIPGRLGDSPIIGAGCYTDQDVGSAGATGSGEENIRVAGAHTIVELMRQGLTPKEAGLETLRRIVRNFDGDRARLRYVEMQYYIVRRDGAYAGVSLWDRSTSGGPRVFVVHDGTQRTEPMVALLEGGPVRWPPE